MPGRVFSVIAMQLTIAPARAVVSTDSTFEAFYRAEADGLYRALTVALGNRELAREATDEGLVRAYQHWRKISRYDNPAGWVYRVSLNWARSRLRKTKREVITDEVYDTASGLPGDPALIAALQQLPMEFRSVVVLRYLLQWSTAEVADALAIPAGTVKSRLSRALEQLRAALEDE
jgi:DNA-directed RNA polymerase specialized sigma24 family protein